MYCDELLCKLYLKSGIEQNSAVYKMILSDIPKEVDITRKQAAIIVHEFLRKVLKEADETDVSRARKLKDLYDCRICVQHIEQVYCKGIMDAFINEEQSKLTGLPVMFGGNELLTDEEADEIVIKGLKHHND